MAQPKPSDFRVCQLNCEDLFLFIDQGRGENFDNFNEKQWQALSSSSIPNKPLAKTRDLAKVLLEINADLVFLNEVGGRESLENFNTYFLSNTYEPLIIEGNSTRGIDVGYLLKRSLGLESKLTSHAARPLNFFYPQASKTLGSTPKSQLFSRDCLELGLFEKNSTRPLLLTLCVHLKSKLDPDGIDPQGTKRREAELKTMVSIYQELHKKWPQTPKIVAGDFNGQARLALCEPEFKSIYELTDLQDVFQLTNRPLELSGTQVQISRSGRVDLIQLDHIFVSKHLRSKVNPEKTYVYMFKSEIGVSMPYAATLEQRSALPSDHYPVVTEIMDLITF